MKNYIYWLLGCFFSTCLWANKTVNVYVWGGEIPKQVLHDFEQKTGITVHFSTYDSNETMYAKLRASKQGIYDVILPSAYFVERMKKHGMLAPLDHQQIPNLTNLDSSFTNNEYDPDNRYSVPLVWGTTGIFYTHKQKQSPPLSWSDLWNSSWRNQLMLLDDSREVFAIALMSLGYNPNDDDPQHIEKAYEHLLRLMPNVKLFASDSIQAIMIDEDALAGLAWNADAYKAQQENRQVHFVYPQEGFIIWVDCLAIPHNAPHPKEAHKFINFLLTPQAGKQIALIEGHALTNAKAKALLPASIRTNPIVYPDQTTLKNGHFQRAIDESKLSLYNQYWQQLKLSFSMW